MRRLAGFLALALLAAPAWAAEKIALVIGNDDYAHVTRLERAVADARAYRDHLRDVRGFDVVYVENGDLASTAGSVTWFLSKVNRGDTAMVVYAGHAVQLDPDRRTSLYILPIDFPEVGQGQGGEIGFIREHAIDFAGISDRVAGKGAALRISVFDACRNNPFATSVRASRTGLLIAPAIPGAGDGAFSFFAAAPGECPLESVPGDTDPNSVFSRVFLRHFLPGVALEDLANEVQAEVLELSLTAGYPQIPTYTDGVAGRACIEENCER